MNNPEKENTAKAILQVIYSAVRTSIMVSTHTQTVFQLPFCDIVAPSGLDEM